MGGIDAFFTEALSLIPQDEVLSLFFMKMEESNAFSSFLEKINASDYENLTENLKVKKPNILKKYHIFTFITFSRNHKVSRQYILSFEHMALTLWSGPRRWRASWAIDDIDLSCIWSTMEIFEYVVKHEFIYIETNLRSASHDDVTDRNENLKFKLMTVQSGIERKFEGYGNRILSKRNIYRTFFNLVPSH